MRFVAQRRPRDLVNITPLIDVVFILLIFFMLAGAIEKPDPVEVEPPRSDAEEEGDEEDVVILIGAEGEVAFQDKPMADDSELVRTAAVWLAYRPNSAVQLKADGGADAARVIEVMELLREAGVRSLVLLTVGGQG